MVIYFFLESYSSTFSGVHGWYVEKMKMEVGEELNLWNRKLGRDLTISGSESNLEYKLFR
jgi:hypothetical protein